MFIKKKKKGQTICVNDTTLLYYPSKNLKL